MIKHKSKILKLNANYMPIEVGEWKDVMTNIVSGAAYPVDVQYALDESGSYTKKIESFYPIKTWKEWEELPIRECDEYVVGARKAYRLPVVVICSRYDQVRWGHSVFPTSRNIYKRDNYTCQYTGKKLQKHELSMDHIIPVSKGGQNTWTNLVCCDRELNSWKGSRTLKECGLTLLQKPVQPVNGVNRVFEFMKDEWNIFLGGDYDSTY
jgi:5-methylcytosine-specific restriction endonuclease McrA